jgi:hypothetical protein
MEDGSRVELGFVEVCGGKGHRKESLRLNRLMSIQ